MRHNPDYAFDDLQGVAALVRENPWCTFVTALPGRGAVVSHYPVVVEEGTPDELVIVSHVGRPDERLHELGQHELLAIAYGPSGYVSPGWYGVSPAVPTWNFQVAHLWGTPELLSDEENLEVLARMVDRFEDVLPEPFSMRRSIENVAYAERIVRGTVGFRMRVTRFEGKDKMSQDKPAEVVERVVTQLDAEGPYRNPALAAHMRRLHGLTAG